jgi:hypothetical protein
MAVDGRTATLQQGKRKAEKYTFRSFKVFVVTTKCYCGGTMKGGFVRARSTHLRYEKYGRIFVGSS